MIIRSKEKKESVTYFYLNPFQLEKFIHQNNAEYTGDYFPGCLLDNFIIACKRGYAFIYNHYLNPNSSDYLVKFIPYKAAYSHDKNYDKLWSEFFELESNYIREYGSDF